MYTVAGSSVTVGRTVGLKKDEFFLGGKTVKKGDIQVRGHYDLAPLLCLTCANGGRAIVERA